MHRTGSLRAGVVVTLVAFLSAAHLHAQLFPGRVSGVVRDAQGGVIVGAEVRLASADTGLERTTATDANGLFDFPQLALATYTVTVTKEGFQKWVQTGVKTSTGQVNDLEVVLPVGSVTTEVTVTGAPPLVQTETNAVGGVLSAKQLTELPIGNEDYTRFALLLPGVTQNTNFAFSNFTVNGARSRSSSFNIDGAANTDPYIQLPSINQGGNSATAATRLPPDAIEELNLVSQASADFGQSAGGVLNVIVRSGTNQLHGSAYLRLRDQSLNAHNFFENLAGRPKAPFSWKNYGGSVGGPLIKDRTFFFGAYDGSRLSVGTTLNSRAPSSAEIQDATDRLFDATDEAPNPLGLAILDLYQPLSGAFVNSNRGQQSPDSGVFKMDHKILNSDSLSGRYLVGNGMDVFPVGGPGPGGGSQLEPYFGVTPTRVHNFAVSEVHIFSPRLLNTARIGYNRFHQAFQNRDNTFDPASIGLVTGSVDLGLPEIDVGTGSGRYVNLGTALGFPSERHDTTYQLADDVSYTAGKHSLKFGVNYFHNHVFGFNDNQFRGLVSFDGSQLGLSLVEDDLEVAPDQAAIDQLLRVASLIDLLGGLPSPGVTAINRGGTRYDVSQNIFSAYVSDTYRVAKNFTLIYGLRYELIGVPSEDRGRFSNFLPGQGLLPVDQLPGGRIHDLVKTNFGPRIAFTYSPFSIRGRRTVIRAGYGIFHDITPLDLLVGEGLNIANLNPGLATNPTGSTTGVFRVAPAAPVPFGPGVPIFGTGAPAPPFDLIGIDPNLKPQNAQNYNVNVQQELTREMVFQIGYVGSKGTHLFHLLDLNQPTPGDPGTADSRRPLAATFPEFRKVDIIRSVGTSSYNSLQMTLRMQNYHGLTTQVSYTWSHNIDTGSETLDFFGTSGFVPQDSNRLDRSESEFDQRHAFILALIYNFPSPFRGGLSYLLNGWQISTVTQLRSGFAAPVLTFDDRSGTNSLHDRPDCTGPIVTQLDDLTQPYVVSGLSSPGTGAGTFGNCKRNPIVAPGLRVADISLGKDFRIKEGITLQFRADFFNAFNHPNFGEPSPDPGTFITGTADDASFDSHFGPGGPRNIQLNWRLRF